MSQLTRRELLKWGLMGTGAVVLAACAPKEPTPAPAAAAPAVPKAAAPEPKEEVITLRFLTRQGTNGDHHREFAKVYAERTNGKVVVETEEVPWGEVAKTLETQYITDTMVDATWGDNAWWPRLATIGAFLVIEDYAAAAGLDLTKWFNIDWFRRWTDGKLSGLGGCAGSDYMITFYNKEMVQSAWGKEPSEGWSWDDYYEMCLACATEGGEGVFGAIPATGGNHTAHAFYRHWGTGLINKEGTQSMFSDPETQDAIRYVMKGLEEGAFPGREDQAEGAMQMFLAGKLAAITSNPGASNGMVAGCEEANIDLGVILGPIGVDYQKHGTIIHSPYTNTFGVYSGTKYPQEAFDLIRTVASVESMVWLCLHNGKQPGAELDSWRDPRIAEKFPWFPEVADVLEESIGKAWFPMPGNTRYTEWKDVGDNEIPALIYGEVPYNQANIDAITDHSQIVLDLPMPPRPNR